MSAAKHTEGPWRAAAAGSSVVDIPVVGPGGRAIASLRFMPWPRLPEQDAARVAYNGEQLANARLIAAAPDLLALAHQYASECGECACPRVCPDEDEDGNALDVQCAECADIWEIIDRAEGRS